MNTDVVACSNEPASRKVRSIAR